VPEPAEFEVVGGLDLVDLFLEAVDGLDEGGAVVPAAVAQFLHLQHEVTQSVVETDHVLAVCRRRHQQTPERVGAADRLTRRTLTVHTHTHTHTERNLNSTAAVSS